MIKNYPSIRVLFFCFILLISSTTFANTGDNTVTLHANQSGVSTEKKIIVNNQDLDELNKNWNKEKIGVSVNSVLYKLKTPVESLKKGLEYELVSPNNESYFLSFTELPLIQIKTEGEFKKLPKEQRVTVSGKLILTESNKTEISTDLTIVHRGATSYNRKKSSYRVKFIKTEGKKTKKNKIKMLSLRESDDWNLQSAYVEPFKINTKISYDLWKMMYTPHYIKESPKAVSGPSIDFVELVLNGEYQGVYCLGERVDRDLLKLKKYNKKEKKEKKHGILIKADDWEGVGYEYPPAFDNTKPSWQGYEWKYPKEKIEWDDLYNLRLFVHKATDEEFYSQYKEKVVLENLVDYYVFMNLLDAWDNKSKNIFTAKYSQEDKFFFVPWDLDGTWGRDWAGNSRFHTEIHTNQFYNRLLKHPQKSTEFLNLVKKRWTNLRQKNGLFHIDNLKNLIMRNHDYLFDNGVYKREDRRWGGSSGGRKYDAKRLERMLEFVEKRTEFLDERFYDQNLISKTTGVNLVSKKQENHQVLIYPNPSKDQIYVNFHHEKPRNLIFNLYDISGQMVLSEVLKEREESIFLDAVTSGVYIVQIISDEKIIYRDKIIVQK